MGVQAGSEFLKDVCANVEISENASLHSMAMISNYDLLGRNEKERTLQNLENKGLLKTLQRIFNDFIITYPLCPLSFIMTEPIEYIRDKEFINDLKTILGELYKRDSETAIFSAASVIYNQFLNGHMVVESTTSLANFPEIQHYPKTEKSKVIAGGILSAIKMLHNSSLFNTASNWKNYFWDTTFNLQPCKI